MQKTALPMLLVVAFVSASEYYVPPSVPPSPLSPPLPEPILFCDDTGADNYDAGAPQQPNWLAAGSSARASGRLTWPAYLAACLRASFAICCTAMLRAPPA